MGIFTRARDIVSSNLNAILDRAEDPEKLIRLMIQEMEETLVEVKAGCAKAMAARKRLARERDALADKVLAWDDRARLAVGKGRDDLAREALAEKRKLAEVLETLDTDLRLADEHVDQYKDDMDRLEDKLAAARDKRRSLAARHQRAAQSRQVSEHLERYDSAEAMARFEHFERRIERMEAEAELASRPKPQRQTTEEEMARLELDEAIERELNELKAKRADSAQSE